MPLKVLSYNIREGGRFRLRALARVIRAQQPDVVALLEANSRVGAQLLARQLGMRLIFGRAYNAFHVAWLSRLPVTQSANHRLPTLAKTLLEIEVRWQDAPLRLFATLMVRFDNDRQKLFSAMQPLASHWLSTSTEPLIVTSPGLRPRPATSV